MVMKRFEELTDVEVLALTDEQVERYVQLRQAEEGVKFLSTPTEPEPVTIANELKVPVYSVPSFYTLDKAAADKVAALIQDTPRVEIGRNWSCGSNEQYYTKQSDDRIYASTINACTKAVYDEFEAKLKAYKEQRDEYSKANTEYKSNRTLIDEISDDIRGRVRRVWREKHTFDGYVTEFKRYLDLAEGDVEIARRFFNKAYSLGMELTDAVVAATIPVPRSN